jgi:F-type H+-transporting ATPase subunit epsilon
MPNNHFQVEVVAADHKLFSDDAVSLVAPGADGYFGVLRGHAPLVSTLKIGVLRLQPTEDRPAIAIAIAGGFIEVTADHVVVLADAAELAQEIDIDRARTAKERAKERLRTRSEDTDASRAEVALARALNRLSVAGEKSI